MSAYFLSNEFQHFKLEKRLVVI